MSSSPADAPQSIPAFFALKTGTDKYVVKDTASDDLQVGTAQNGALLFQMPGASDPHDGLMLLQMLGGRRHVPAAPSLGVVLKDGSAAHAPFLKVSVGDGFALGTPDKEHWLSVSDEGKLIFSKLASPGVSETFKVETPAQPQHQHKRRCCGPSLPPVAPRVAPAWDDLGHSTIVETAIECLKNPHSGPTTEGKEALAQIVRWESQLLQGLHDADYTNELNDKSSGITWYTSHFYDPLTGDNYAGDNSPTALERGRDFFVASLKVLDYTHGPVNFDIGRRTGGGSLTCNLPDYASREHIVAKSIYLLGVALHYFTDLSQPMHASNIALYYGDHYNWADFYDDVHSLFETYGDEQVRGLLNGYPRLTDDEVNTRNINSVDELYKAMAIEANQVWRQDLKPIYEELVDELHARALAVGNATPLREIAEEIHRSLEKTRTALKKSMYVAPARTARLLLYWGKLVLERAWHNFKLGSSHIYAVNNAGQVCLCSLNGEANEILGAAKPGAPLAQQVGVGGDGSMWVISNKAREGGFAPYYLASGATEWVELKEPAAATKVGVAPDGTAYMMNSAGQIWAFGKPDAEGKSEGRLISGTLLARDIGVGSDGSLWVISTQPYEGNFVPYYLAAGAKDWVKLQGASAMKIAVALDGTARVITAHGEVWGMPKPDAANISPGFKYSDLPGFSGSPFNIGVGSDGSLWVLTTGTSLGVHYLANGANEWKFFAYPSYIPDRFAAM